MDADPPKIKLASKVCYVYSYTAAGSFKTEKLRNKTGGRPTSELFGESFLQFFYCQFQLRAVCYGQVAHETGDQKYQKTSVKHYPLCKTHGKTFWVSPSESVFASSSPLLSPPPLLCSPLQPILSNPYLPACCHISTAKAAAEPGRTWSILVPHLFATAEALCFTASYTAHSQTANSASS